MEMLMLFQENLVSLTPCSSYVAGVKPTDLPCGRCHYCVRADQLWGNFTKQVDEAVSLTNLSSGASANLAVDNLRGEEEEHSFNQSDMAVMSENTGNISGFSTDQEFSNADTEIPDNIDMLEEVGKLNSIGTSDAHFDIVRNGNEAISICGI